MPVSTSNTFGELLSETRQGHPIREPLYKEIEGLLEAQFKVKARVAAFFTSMVFPVAIENSDADMIEEMLQNTDLTGRHLFLILNSGGGDGLAAERIVNILRTCGGGTFSVIVPKMAKSAATMICFGADKILLGPTSELGPIDPQIPKRDESGRVADYQAAHEIIEAYEELLKQANTSQGRLEPYLQQLARFDARDIRRIKSSQNLAADIAVKELKSGMLAKLSVKNIRERIKPFLDPKHSISHGRPIYHNIAKQAGLNVECLDYRSDLWRSIWSLYIRLNFVVGNIESAKVIESLFTEYTASPFMR
jgi:ATP-dependent protease ClpP protease subunit